MLHKTRGIVLNYIQYRETSIIAKVFTAAFGLQSYIVHGVRTKKPQYGIALFQPLMGLEMVVYYKKTAILQHLAEVKCQVPINSILTNIKKATIAIFIAELLGKVIHEEESNEKLFNFLWDAMVTFEQQRAGYELFHLTFMLQLCSYLGFGICTAQEVRTQLNHAGQHQGITAKEVALLDNLLQGKSNLAIHINKATRRRLTESMIHFYQLHIDTLATLKSFNVLQKLDT